MLTPEELQANITELLTKPTEQQIKSARKFLESMPTTTQALAALAFACEALVNEADPNEPDPRWQRVSAVLMASIRLVAEAEAEAL